MKTTFIRVLVLAILSSLPLLLPALAFAESKTSITKITAVAVKKVTQQLTYLVDGKELVKSAEESIFYRRSFDQSWPVKTQAMVVPNQYPLEANVTSLIKRQYCPVSMVEASAYTSNHQKVTDPSGLPQATAPEYLEIEYETEIAGYMHYSKSKAAFQIRCIN